MIALLIVHGIGEQRRGETTAKLITGFKAAYGDAVDVGLDGDGYPNAVTANGRTVRLYEVHWAEFLSSTANKGTFSWNTINTLVWHPLWCHRLGLCHRSVFRGPRPVARGHAGSARACHIPDVRCSDSSRRSSTGRGSKRLKNGCASRTFPRSSGRAPTPASPQTRRP